MIPYAINISEDLSTPVQCLLVGEELCLASRFTSKVMSGLVLLVGYISAPMALRYGV